MEASECICKGNWRLLVKNYEPHFDRVFIDKETKKEYCFVGLMHGSDDYYYVLHSKDEMIYLSCVCDLLTQYDLKD